jgi:hypothetical protein
MHDPMNKPDATQDYLLLSRGQWDADKSQEEIQAAIDSFYIWYDQRLADGTFKRGHRLSDSTKVVSRAGITDGPYSEAKEVIGGYWFIVAGSLAEAARIAADNPCLACGLSYEVRPIEVARASAYVQSSETPATGGQ